MDERERARLIGGAYAHTITLRFLVTNLLKDDAGRRAARTQVCEAIESLYGETGLTGHGHLVLQAALEEAEALFQGAPPLPEPTPEEPDRP